MRSQTLFPSGLTIAVNPSVSTKNGNSLDRSIMSPSIPRQSSRQMGQESSGSFASIYRIIGDIPMLEVEKETSIHEIDSQAETGENVATNQNVMGSGEGWKPRPVKFYPRTEVGNAEAYGVEAGSQRFSSRLMDETGTDWFDCETVDETRAQAGPGGSGVKKREGANSLGRIAGSGNLDDGARTMLEQTIDRLLKADFGPSGFLIVCHRG